MKLSLRTRLLLGTAGATACVLLSAGVLLYRQIESQLRAEFDHALATKASLLASLVEEEKGEFEFELDDRLMPEFVPGDHAEYFQIWPENDTTTLARSRSLGGHTLPIAGVGPSEHLSSVPEKTRTPATHSGAVNTAPRFRDLLLPDGRLGRCVTITALIRTESHEVRSPTRVVVTYARSIASLASALQRIRSLLIWVSLAAILLSTALLLASVRAGLKPLSELARAISALRPDQPSTRMAMRTPRELTPVVEQMNALLQRVETAIQGEKSFSADVAHELRTPLAGLRSTLEVSLARQRDADDYRVDMAGCLSITTQMQAMVGNLLCLARLETGNLPRREEPIDLHTLLSDCWKPFEDLARDKHLTVTRNGTATHAFTSDKDLLRQVFTNLFENAVHYADAGGFVELDTQTCPTCTQVTIRNSGSQLSAEDAPRSLEHFWRGDTGRQHTGQHCGLGLPLARRLLEHLGGTIQVSSQKGGTFVVTCTLLQHTGTGMSEPERR